MRPEAARFAQWRHEPWTFVREVFGAEPDIWQNIFLHALVGLNLDGSKMAVRYLRFALQACKGPGKSTVLAWAMWWFMLTREMPKIVATSISADNLRDNLWAELSKWQKQSRLLSSLFVWTQDRVYEPQNPETWFMSARSWAKSASPQQQADTLAGIHADHVLFVLDESGGIPPGVLATADAGLANVDEAAGREGLVLQAGNPTDVTGALYQAAGVQRALWHVQEISGDPDDPNRAPRVSLEWARALIAEYGRNHPWVLVNVLGRFAPGASDSLISLHDVTAAKDRRLTADRYHDSPLILGVDVARFGDDETVMCLRQGVLVHPLWVYRRIDTMKTAGLVARIINERNPDAVFIDQTGLGAGVVDRLREQNFAVQGIDSAGEPLDRACLNKRAEMWLLMSKWVTGEVSLPDDPQLISQMPAPKFKYTSSGLLQLESKADMVKRGVSSPDRADALGFTFAMPVAHRGLRLNPERTSTAKMAYDWRTHGK